MTKEIKYSLLLFLGVLMALGLKLPIELLLNYSYKNHILNDLLAGSICRFLIVLVLCYLISCNGFLRYNGLYPTITIRNLELMLIPGIIILLIAFTNIATYKQTGINILFLFGLNAALTGTLEELTLRGMVLPLLLRHYAGKRNPFIKAILLSSLLFGIAHFISLFRDPQSVSQVISQVIFALGIGFFLAALFFRTGNIIVPIVIHFLINFAGGAYRLKEDTGNEIITSKGSELSDYIPVIIISMALISFGMYMLKRINKDEWFYKISFIKLK